MPIFLIFALVIAFFAIVFALQNNAPIIIRFLVWESTGSLALVLLVTLAVGAIIGLLVSVPTILKRGWKTARERRKVEELESRFRSKEEDVSKQSQKVTVMQHHYDDLLQAFALTDPTTHLIKYSSLSKVLAHILNQMQLQTSHERYESIALFMIASEAATPTDSTVLQTKNKALVQAIAHRLKKYNPVNQWLFSNGHDQFACVVLGLNQHSASEYGESLRDALTQQPMELDDQSEASIMSNVGGAIAHRQFQVSEQELLQTAQHALEQAQSRGKNRVRLLQVNK